MPADPRLIQLSRPARHFHEAFLLGNGSLGASLHGRPGTERIDLNLDTVWSGGPATSTPAPRAEVTVALRAALAAGDHAAADALARRLQASGWTQSYQPVGALEWKWMPGAEASRYHRALDLGRGVATTAADGDTLTAFVSHPDGVLVAETTGRSGVLTFDSPHQGAAVRTEEIGGARWLVATGRAPAHVVPEFERSPHPVRYAQDRPAPDGTVPAGMGWAVVAVVAPTSAGSRLVATVVSGFRRWDLRPSADLDELAARARVVVEAALARSTRDLAARHEADHRELFDRVRLDLAPAGSDAATDAQRYFDFGRYLLIASSRRGSQAANLQGIWNDDVRPGWASEYTTNINTQMNYWGAEVAALPELHEPLFDLVRDLAEAGRATAATVYGASGATAHHNTDVWRFTEPVDGRPQWANWQSGLLWAASHLGTRLDTAWDEDFARTTALPVLHEVVAFALDQLVELDGVLVASPSSSPEHDFVDSTGFTGAVTVGASMDQELIAEALHRFVDLDARLGAGDELAARAGAALGRLALPEIDATGRLREWWRPELADPEPGHRHLSHLYGVFPGHRITETREPDAFEAVRRSLAHRLAHGSGYTGWSQAWVLCLAARLRDRELAAASVHALVHALSSTSLLDLHPHAERPGGVLFQIDGNLGAIAGIAELILQSHDGALSLLPTLPVEWTAGSVAGLRARGGHAVDIVWANGCLESAVVTSSGAGELILEFDDALAVELTGLDGRSVTPTAEPVAPAGRARWRVRTEGVIALRARRG